jgi:hypothetical protein
VIVTNLQYGLVSGWAGVKGIDICLVFVIPCVFKPKNFAKEHSKDFLLVHEIFMGLTIVHLANSSYVRHLDSQSYTSALLADAFMKWKVSSIMIAFYIPPLK